MMCTPRYVFLSAYACVCKRMQCYFSDMGAGRWLEKGPSAPALIRGIFMTLNQVAKDLADQIQEWNGHRMAWELDLLSAFKARESADPAADPDDLDIFEGASDPDVRYLFGEFFEDPQFDLYINHDLVCSALYGCDLVTLYVSEYADSQSEIRILDDLLGQFYNHAADFDDLAAAIESTLQDMCDDLYTMMEDPDLSKEAVISWFADNFYSADLVTYCLGESESTIRNLVDMYIRDHH